MPLGSSVRDYILETQREPTESRSQARASKDSMGPVSGSFFFCEHPAATTRAVTILRAAEEQPTDANAPRSCPALGAFAFTSPETFQPKGIGNAGSPSQDHHSHDAASRAERRRWASNNITRPRHHLAVGQGRPAHLRDRAARLVDGARRAGVRRRLPCGPRRHRQEARRSAHPDASQPRTGAGRAQASIGAGGASGSLGAWRRHAVEEHRHLVHRVIRQLGA